MKSPDWYLALAYALETRKTLLTPHIITVNAPRAPEAYVSRDVTVIVEATRVLLEAPGLTGHPWHVLRDLCVTLERGVYTCVYTSWHVSVRDTSLLVAYWDRAARVIRNTYVGEEGERWRDFFTSWVAFLRFFDADVEYDAAYLCERMFPSPPSMQKIHVNFFV